MHRRRRDGEIGRRSRLKICRWKHRAGSIPAPGTNSQFKAIQYSIKTRVKPSVYAGFLFYAV